MRRPAVILLSATFVSLLLLRVAAPLAADTSATQAMDEEIQGSDPSAVSPQPQVEAEDPLEVVATVSDEPLQTIKGWGCFPGYYRTDWNSELHVNFDYDDVHQALYRDLGMTVMRVEILPKFYDAGKDDGSLDTELIDASLYRHLKIAHDYGLSNWISSTWSPPALFKDPPVTKGRDEDGNATHLRPDREDDYCRYMANVLLYLIDKGLEPPQAVSIQNELSYAAGWDGCVYEPGQYHRVLLLMRRTFDEAGLQDIPIIGPESGSYTGNFDFFGGAGYPLLHTDPDIREALGAAAYHGYSRWSNEPGVPEQMRVNMLSAKRAGKDVWMTEFSYPGSDYDPFTDTIRAMRRLGRETVYIPSNYWIWWMGVSYKYGQTMMLSRAPDKPLVKGPLFHVCSVLWNNAAPGCVVKRIDTNDPDLRGFDPYDIDLVAFDSPERMTLLLVNHTERPRGMTLNRLPGTQAQVHQFTDGNQTPDPATVTIEDRSATLSLPPQSITIAVTNQGAMD